MAKRGSSKPSPGASDPRSPAKIGLDDSVRVLILAGPESHLRAERLASLRQAVESRRGEVDVLHFDGAAASPADVLDEARSLGLMQQYKIIVVDEAEEFLKRGDNRRSMERYAEHPADDVTLVLRSAAWHAGKLDKLVEAVGLVLRCDSPEPPEAVDFCIDRCRQYGCAIEPAAAHLLVERIGTSLGRLDSELARLSLMVEDGAPIAPDLVRGQIPLSREEKAWELQDALVTGNATAAMTKLIELMTVSRHDPVPLFWSIADLSRKIYAAGRLLKEGQHERSIVGRLRIFGSAAGATMNAARRVPSPLAARLTAESLRAAHRARQGLGSPERAVEIMALRFVSAVAPR